MILDKSKEQKAEGVLCKAGKTVQRLSVECEDGEWIFRLEKGEAADGEEERAAALLLAGRSVTAADGGVTVQEADGAVLTLEENCARVTVKPL